MSIARFFQRAHAAIGRHVAVTPEALAEQLGASTVGIECCSAADRNGALACELLTNQVARLYPRVCIFGAEEITSRCRDLARAINPSIEITDDPTSLTASVSSLESSRTGAIAMRSEGWNIFLGGKIPAIKAKEPNVYSAAATASLAAAALFRRVVLNQTEQEPQVRLSLLTYGEPFVTESPRPQVNLGPLLVAGLGAVGNAALWCLARDPMITGEAWVVDPEAIELSNLQRYVLATEADVDQSKTALAERELQTSAITTHPVNGRLGETPVPSAFESALVTVDNVPGRRVAQALLPRLVVNGWTSESGLGASWHMFDNGLACLACMYHPREPALSQTERLAAALGLPHQRVGPLWVRGQPLAEEELRQVAQHYGQEPDAFDAWKSRSIQDFYANAICGSAAVQLRARETVEVVPLAHQSVLAGVLAAVELVKRSSSELRSLAQSENGVAWHDVTRSPPNLWAQTHAQEPGCICSDEIYQGAYRKKWRSASSQER